MNTADKKPDCGQSCKSCGHWFAPLRMQNVGIGQCRESAPISSFSWPRTREEDVCSKWKPLSDAGAGAHSQPAAVEAGSEHVNVAGAKAEAGGPAGPAFARGKSTPRLRR